MLQYATFKSYVKTFPPVQFSQNKQLVLQAWGMADRMGVWVCVGVCLGFVVVFFLFGFGFLLV